MRDRERERETEREGMDSDYLMSTEFWFCKMKRVLETDGDPGCTTM